MQLYIKGYILGIFIHLNKSVMYDCVSVCLSFNDSRNCGQISMRVFNVASTLFSKLLLQLIEGMYHRVFAQLVLLAEGANGGQVAARLKLAVLDALLQGLSQLLITFHGYSINQ